MNIQEIREQRAAVIANMRALENTAEREDRDLSDDELRRFDEGKAKLATFDKRLERAELLAAAERSMDVDRNSPRAGHDGTFEEACRSFQVTRAIAAMIAPGEVDGGREFELSAEIARRSGRKPTGLYVPHEVFLERRDVLTSGSGGNLVPTQHRADLFVDRLRASLQVQALGATVLNGLVGDQDIPRLTGSATGYWVAEHGAITESNHTFDTVSLSPQTVGAEVEYSRRMLINAVPAVEALVRGDLANVLATEIDAKAIAGDGTGNTPTGVLNTSGVTWVALGTNGDNMTYERALEVISTVSSDNALGGSLGWLTHPKLVKVMRHTPRIFGATDTTPATAFTPSDNPSFVMNSPDDLAGYTLRQSTQVPINLTKGTGTDLSAAIFGNWSDLLIGYWSAVDILVNPYHSDVYSKGGVKINALQDVDIAVRHPESFSGVKDALLTPYVWAIP